MCGRAVLLTRKLGFWIMTLTGLAVMVWWLCARAGAGELQTVLRLLPSLSKPWLATAVMLEVLFTYSQSLLFKTIYGALGFHVPVWRLFIITLVSRFVGHVVPLGTAATVVTFVSTAKREGLPARVSSIANALFYFFDYAGFGLFVAYTLAFLKFSGLLPSVFGILLTAILILIAAGVTVLSLALKNPGAVVSVSRVLANVAARIPGWVGRKSSDALRSIHSVEPVATRVRDSFTQPKTLVTVMASSFAITLTDVLILYSVVRAAGIRIGFGGLNAAFTMGTVAALLSFIPNGIGVYVVSLWSALTYMGLDSVIAGSVALVYRAVTFWLPTLAGLVALKYVGDRRHQSGGKGKRVFVI